MPLGKKLLKNIKTQQKLPLLHRSDARGKEKKPIQSSMLNYYPFPPLVYK